MYRYRYTYEYLCKYEQINLKKSHQLCKKRKEEKCISFASEA